MASLYISEYTQNSIDSPTLVSEPSVSSQVVAFTATAGTSTAFRTDTRMVRLHPDGICSIKFGVAPTAVANTDARMVAGQTEYFKVTPGFKVSAVTST
jgi:hypothetical protein